MFRFYDAGLIVYPYSCHAQRLSAGNVSPRIVARMQHVSCVDPMDWSALSTKKP